MGGPPNAAKLGQGGRRARAAATRVGPPRPPRQAEDKKTRRRQGSVFSGVPILPHKVPLLGRRDKKTRFCKKLFPGDPEPATSGTPGAGLLHPKSCLLVFSGPIHATSCGKIDEKREDKPSIILSSLCLLAVFCGISQDIRFCPGRTRPPLLMCAAPSYDIVKYRVLSPFCKTKLSLGALSNFWRRNIINPQHADFA